MEEHRGQDWRQVLAESSHNPWAHDSVLPHLGAVNEVSESIAFAAAESSEEAVKFQAQEQFNEAQAQGASQVAAIVAVEGEAGDKGEDIYSPGGIVNLATVLGTGTRKGIAVGAPVRRLTLGGTVVTTYASTMSYSHGCVATHRWSSLVQDCR